MRRREFLKGMGAAAMSLSLGGVRQGFGQSEINKRPNFIFILVDDLGWADVGCYGSKFYETPNIDKLAREGMQFSDGYATCAVCSPSRSSVLTGRYPTRTGVTDWIHYHYFKGDKNDPNQEHSDGWEKAEGRKLLCPKHHLWMDLDEVTIAEVLKKEDYATCHVGKWHLGPDAWFPDKQGFDHNIGGCDFGQPPSYFDPFSRGDREIPTLNPVKKGEYLTDREAQEAVNFIRKNKDRNFFLYMAHYAVHTPIQAKAELTKKYQVKEKTRQKNAKYAAMIESVDQAVGKVISVLEELGLRDDTVVFFTSDNGGLLSSTSNWPLREGKGYPYEGGIREPLVVRWPGKIKAGTKCDVPVTGVDYFPTICEMAGARLPAGRAIDGESLLPLLKQNGKLKRDAIYWHFPHYRKEIKPYSIIRKGDWKLIKFYEPFNGKQIELYNLKDDLSEKNDLAGERKDKVEELSGQLDVWLKETGAKMPRQVDSL